MNTNNTLICTVIYSMKEEYKALQLVHNKEKHRFELEVDGQLAIIEYITSPAAIYLTHTEVAEEIEGKGVASAIIEKTLNYIESENLKLIPLCPLVAAYIKRHPEWERVLDARVNIGE